MVLSHRCSELSLFTSRKLVNCSHETNKLNPLLDVSWKLLKKFIEWKIRFIIGFYEWNIYSHFTSYFSIYLEKELNGLKSVFPLECLPKNLSWKVQKFGFNVGIAFHISSHNIQTRERLAAIKSNSRNDITGFSTLNTSRILKVLWNSRMNFNFKGSVRSLLFIAEVVKTFQLAPFLSLCVWKNKLKKTLALAREENLPNLE